MSDNERFLHESNPDLWQQLIKYLEEWSQKNYDRTAEEVFGGLNCTDGEMLAIEFDRCLRKNNLEFLEKILNIDPGAVEAVAIDAASGFLLSK